MAQISITFPDSSKHGFPKGVTGKEIASSISMSLAKQALVIELDGKLCDLSLPIETDAKIRIITDKNPESLEVLRHDAAHLLAHAVKELYPETQVTIGPAIENGFYYDFARETPFTENDLPIIENKMREIANRDDKITRELWKRADAVSFFTDQGEEFKAKIIESIPTAEDITLYRQGEFIDLCRGPHGPSTGRVKYFKLMKVAGAYFRGDPKQAQLQRIYGTAWATAAELEKYLFQLEEAAKRDHRKLARELELFHMQEEAAGSVFWHEKGFIIYHELENYIRGKLRENDYFEVKTPQMIDKILWEKSGHWEKFRDDMFVSQSEERTFAIKPMSCPAHIQIFNQGVKSYRQLPLRMAEFGSCHRNEPSGSLHGLMRVRSFVQDDAHIFCEEHQITDETIKFCELLKSVYHDLGFDEVKVKFSTRPKVRAGTDETWDKAEGALQNATKAANLEYILNEGDGAFYGPKLEFHLTDALGRSWQCGTLQVDFVLPERLDASYVASDGTRKRPVILHRAILGTLERFMGILIEHHAGKFPLWLAPVQAVVTTITNDADAYAREVFSKLKAAGIRVEIDVSAEKINYKIREHSLKKVPYILVVGKKEAESGSVSVRTLGEEKSSVVHLDELINNLQNQITEKRL